MIYYVLYRVIDALFVLYTLAIFARALLPWLGVSPSQPVMGFLYRITEPLLAPIRRRLPPTGALDLSPLVLLLILWVAEQVLLWALRRLL
jgi:YggT family protein